jgi:hypothetical protein
MALTTICLIVAAIRFVPGVLPTMITDFAGGMAIGLGIATIIVWLGERTPKS